MSNQNALTIYNQFDQLERAADALYKSGYFNDVKSQVQAMVKVMAGAELGLPPFASMAGINIIQGKPALGANIIATLVKNDPRYDYQIEKATDEECLLTWYEGGKRKGTSGFTMAEAGRAGLTTKDNWKKYPSDMLFARAITRGARRFAPGIFGGSPVYTPEELGADTDEEGNIILEGQAREVQNAPTSQAPSPALPTNGASRPYSPETLRAKLEEIASLPKFNTYQANDAQRILLRHALELCFAGDPAAEDKRHTVAHYLTGKESTKDIPGPLVKAMLDKWLKPQKDDGGEYHVDAIAATEAESVYTEALKAEGQTELPFDDNEIPQEFR